MAKKKTVFISDVCEAFIAFESSLKRYLGRLLYKPEDIDDMAQETFLRAYNATRGQKLEFPKAYLFQVAKTMAFKELSRKSRQLTYCLEAARLPEEDLPPTLDEEIAADQKVQLFCDAIAELPLQCRRVFLMRKFQALSHKEIAKELGITTSAVEKQIALGTARCKKYVDSREKERNQPIKRQPPVVLRERR